MVIAEGFPGQRKLVLTPRAVAEARRRPGTRHLVVTDVGYFPEARRHGMVRERPIDQAVVLLCTRGAGHVSTPEGRFAVAPGQAAVIPPGVPHDYQAEEKRPWTLWWMHVIGQDLEEFLEAAGITARSPIRTVGDILHAASLVEETLRWMERDITDATQLASSGAAWHLMALLAAGRSPSDHRSRAIDAAADRIRQAPEVRLDIEALASSCHLSRSHFSALFTRQLGMSVLRFQTELRMSRARELLDTTELSVARVADRVGYDDAYYFTRQFGKVHGMTPTAYRRRAE
ncbi:AraC family transcriptional regulator [Demequina lignilytica]|uniref:AraC family transcriptional regulator n=1 Tax=Demequina lignilytica TaxID=3051663 RepID=A0AB35MEQ6_9MICO|nr:AraC family transcriptional regulator [Demequina sp. SYSU T0a273]MDN4482262.1 AraC family transcriptional regulator [Demequina sp. SYSU T0a273]